MFIPPPAQTLSLPPPWFAPKCEILRSDERVDADLVPKTHGAKDDRCIVDAEACEAPQICQLELFGKLRKVILIDLFFFSKLRA